MLGLIVRVVGAFYWQARIVSSSESTVLVDSIATDVTERSPRFYFGDSLSYWTLGRHIARGEPYEYTESRYTIFRTPGYPLLLAPIFLLWGNDPPEWTFRLESILFSMLGILLTLWWLRRLYFSSPRFPTPSSLKMVRTTELSTTSVVSEDFASDLRRRVFGTYGFFCVAAFFLIFSPSSIVVSVLVLTESAFIPLMLATLWWWSVATERTRWKGQLGWAFLTGVVSGFATLVRPSWLLFPFGAIGFFLLFGLGIPRRRHLVVASGVVLGTLCVLSPWWIRNFQISGRFIPTTLQQGTSLLDGWNATSDGSSCWEPVQAEIDRLQRDFESQHHYTVGEAPLAERVAFECQMNDHCANMAKRWAAENPWRACWLAIKKVGRFWNPIPNEEAFRKPLILLGLLFCYVPVLLAAMRCVWLEIVQLMRVIRRQPLESCQPQGLMQSVQPTDEDFGESVNRRMALWLCTLPLFYFTAMHAIFVSSIRYREPLWPLLIILAVEMVLGACSPQSDRNRSLQPI